MRRCIRTDVRSSDIPDIECSMERRPVTLLILGIGIDSRMSKQEPNEFKGCRVRRRARSVQHSSSKCVPRVNIQCRCITGERRVPLSPGAAAPTTATGRAQLVLMLVLVLGSGCLALLKSSLEFSLFAESKVSMKHAHICKSGSGCGWSEASRCALLTRMQRIRI
jgi:hypothetical protein